ncbi:MAG: DUF4340 domain-containing protein [Clostridia bacterium]|nr:DUF4340 domain-containing protein [Clostridia bacterium]
MKKHQFLLLLLLGAAVLLLVAYLAIVRPIVNRPDDPAPPVTTGEGEGLQYNKYTLLFPAKSRSDIMAIKVHNEHGEYMLARTSTEEGKAPTNTSPFVIYKKKDDGYVGYPFIAYNEESFASLIVATGTFYYMTNVTEEATAAGQTIRYADYGLDPSQDPAWFELTLTEGEPLRVYIGDVTVNGKDYYVRLEGRDAVYVSSSSLVKDTAFVELSSFVSPALTSFFVEYGYYYTKDFSLFKGRADTVTRNSMVSYNYRTYVDGTLSEEEASGPVNLRTAKEAIVTALLGKRVGDSGITFTLTEDGKSVEYRITELTSVIPLSMAVDFVNASERSDFYAGVAYHFTAPEERLAYHPNSSHYMSVLEALGALVGTRTVAVGLDLEEIERYGLDAHVISYLTPKDARYDSVNENDILVDEYELVRIYISEKQADGTYYVGSELTDIVAVVDGETLAFLEHSNAWWLNSSLYSVNINKAGKLTFDFDYGDVDKTYTFDIRHTSVTGDKLSVSAVIYGEENAFVNVDAFKSFYMHLVSTDYADEYRGSVPIPEVLAGPRTLTMTLEMTDGETYVYRFYPYSERRVLVSLSTGGGAEGAYFYIYTSEVEKIYRDIALLVSGGVPDPEKQY